MLYLLNTSYTSFLRCAHSYYHSCWHYLCAEVAIAFDRGERMFGSDAVGALTRKPLDAFTHFREMLGRTLDHSAVEGVGKHQ